MPQGTLALSRTSRVLRECLGLFELASLCKACFRLWTRFALVCGIAPVTAITPWLPLCDEECSAQIQFPAVYTSAIVFRIAGTGTELGL